MRGAEPDIAPTELAEDIRGLFKVPSEPQPGPRVCSKRHHSSYRIDAGGEEIR